MRYKVGDKGVVKNGFGVTQDINGFYYSESTPIKEVLFKNIMTDHEATAKLKGGHQMTKSDLKDGMVVELRNGEKRLVLNNKLIDNYGYLDFDLFTSDLKHTSSSNTIIKVYETKGRYFDELLLKDYLEPIWQRQDKSEAEMKLEQLQQQIAEMKAKTAELEQTVEELKGGMAR